jgi:hypothetical protein
VHALTEFRFVAACCAWPPSRRRNQAVREALGKGFDWSRVPAIVARQRVAGLVQDAVQRAGVVPPAQIAAGLSAAAQNIAFNGMRFAAQSLNLQRSFDTAGIAALFVKGAALGVEAYGATGLKHSWDIDLLVRLDQVGESAALLESLGYRPAHPVPPSNSADFRRWMRFAREFVFFAPDGGAPVELHWKLLENPHLMPGITAASPSHAVAVSGAAQLRTLQPDTLFAYLCAHGAMHGWSRLKWLADVNALIAGDDEARLAQRLSLAAEMKVEHCMAQAYLLCDRLFATPALTTLARDLRRGRRYCTLERIALGALTKGDGARELDTFAFSEFAISCSHFLLGRGPRFMACELWNKLNRPYDLVYGGAKRWGGLYPLGRLVAWVCRRGRRRPLPRPGEF